MNTGTKLRTILAIATSLNTALMATDLTGFQNPVVDTVYKIASIVLNFVIVAIVTYYNNDYTKTAAEYTQDMRLAKKPELPSDLYESDIANDEEGGDTNE